MKIESVDFFYLRIPVVRDVGDGSQDALLVRVRGGGKIGWGECEASPLVSIASWCCPMSHSACKPVKDSVLGQNLETPQDIERINRLVGANGLDLAQTAHTLSGIDIALWDLLGQHREEPVYRLLGAKASHAKRPYASQLFGDTPEATYEKARQSVAQNYTAVKFGWGPYGRGDVATDAAHVRAAREGLGHDIDLMVDAGTVWEDDVELAIPRLAALQEHRVLWLEEPFVGGALQAHAELAAKASPVAIAGGEGARHFDDARNLIDHGSVGYIQIDTGRIGGITPARRVAKYAEAHHIRFINHTFTTHLALSASLQPFADMPEHDLCEYPVEASDIAQRLVHDPIHRAADGTVQLPERPGLGMVPDAQVINQYLLDVQIHVGGDTIYSTPTLDDA